MSLYAIGVDLGGTTVKAGLVSASEGVIARTRRPTDAHLGTIHILQQIAEVILELRAHPLPPDAVLCGIGIGSPGTISWDRTTVSRVAQFPGWEVVNLHDEVRRRMHYDGPVIVENDANVAGLGSAFYGAGKPFDSFIMATLGTGVGGAIIYHKRLFRGMTGGAGEIGHMTIDFDGPFARSGVPGALEAYLGIDHLTFSARHQLLATPGLLHERLGDALLNLTPKDLTEAAEDGDPGARAVLAYVGHKLGAGVGAAINLLDIRKVVVGGGISAAGDFILEPARQAMRQFVMPGLRDDLELVQETLGNEVALLGAARLAFEYHEEHA